MNGLQAPPGYEEIKKPVGTPFGYEEVLEAPRLSLRPRMEPSDWKREFLPEFRKITAEHIRGEIKKAPQMLTSKYWKKTYGNVKQSIQDIADLTGFTMTPETREKIQRKIKGLPAKPAITPEKERITPTEVAKRAAKLITWLPEMGYKFVRSPVDTIRDDPVGTVFLFMVASPKVRSLVKEKIRAGRPINVHKAIKSIPDNVIGKGAKQAVLEGILPDYAIDLAKLTTRPMPGFPKIGGLTPVQKIINALKPAKVIRKQQEALYTEVRGERFPKALEALEKVRGKKGFEAAKGELKGKMRRVEFEPIVEKLTQADVESLFNQIIDSRAVTGIDKISAGEGLTKLLGEKGGVIPTASELALLNKVYPKELVQTILSKRATWDKIRSGMLEGVNVPRALMASYDLSFGLRQGIFLAARYPKEFSLSFLRQFKLFGSDKAFKALNEDIVNRPTYKLMKRGGGRKELALTQMDAALGLREEAFMGAALAEKIPVVGLGVRASNRAYTGFANKLRADVFDHLIKSSEKAGRNPWKDSKLVDGIIDFVNAGSGRGNLPKAFEKAAVELNTVLFSPRLMSSRLSLLNPRFYVKLDPFARKQALQSLFAFTGMTTTVLGLAKLGGAEVGVNPLSADFGKIKIGDTRIDIMGGFQQYIRTASQFVAGKMVSTTTGKVRKTGEGYDPMSRGQILGRGLEYKLAPVASFAVGIYRGRSTFGGEFDIPEEIGKRFVPMVMQDVADLARDDPELLPLATLGFFGMGLQTYKPRKKKGVVY